MRFSLVACLAALAIAAPDAKIAPPPLSSSNGFRLMVHVVKGDTYTRVLIEGEFLQIYPDRYKHNVQRLRVDGDRNPKARPNPNKVFYLNGTAEDVKRGTTTLVLDGVRYTNPNNDSQTVQSPMSMLISPPDPYDDTRSVNLTYGIGTKGVKLSPASDPLSYLTPDTWGIEFESEAHIGWTILQGRALNPPPGSYQDPTVIRLIPECAQLDQLTPGSESNHDFAQTVRCYDDTQSIDWAQYDKHCF